jgi:hypothetical protein
MPINKDEAEIIAEQIVKKVLTERSLLPKLLQGILSKDDSERYPSSIAAELLSERNPQIIYHEWDFFVDLMRSKNAFHRATAVITISNLSIIDLKGKFEDLFEEYFKLFDDKSLIVTRKLVIYVGRIIKAKPLLRERIIEILLSIDDTEHSSSRKDLIKGDIIETLSEFYEEINNKNEIIKFVKNQLSSSSPSTVKRAKIFLSLIN